MTTVDYSASNVALWNAVVQMGIIAATILFANLLRRRFRFIRMSMMPTAVLGGLILLVVKVIMDKCFDITFLNNIFLEKLTYHGIAIGFIAMSLRVPERDEKQAMNHVGLWQSRWRLRTRLCRSFSKLPACCCRLVTVRDPDRLITPEAFIRMTGDLPADVRSVWQSQRQVTCLRASSAYGI